MRRDRYDVRLLPLTTRRAKAERAPPASDLRLAAGQVQPQVGGPPFDQVMFSANRRSAPASSVFSAASQLPLAMVLQGDALLGHSTQRYGAPMFAVLAIVPTNALSAEGTE